MDTLIQRWGALALSLRQMCQELERLRIGHLALRTLTRRLHQLVVCPLDELKTNVPPILQIDAIWITLLRPNGKVRRDRKGRKRAVKGRFKCPVLIAMGVWPDSDRCEISRWQLAYSEDTEEWVTFLSILEERGIRGENGLKLVIHDGGSGLCAAMRTIYFGAHEQRCLFHKRRNIYQAIHVAENLTLKQKSRRRRAIFKNFHAIWQAQRSETVLRRYLKVVRAYRHAQPVAVATLRRDFRSTITYYHLLLQFPSWNRRHLRTTNRLERFNRRLRRRARAAHTYHSEQGLLAMLSQEAHEFLTSQPDH